MGKVLDSTATSPISEEDLREVTHNWSISFERDRISVRRGELEHRAVLTTINFTEVIAYMDEGSIMVHPVSQLSKLEQKRLALFQDGAARRQVIERTSQVLV